MSKSRPMCYLTDDNPTCKTKHSGQEHRLWSQTVSFSVLALPFGTCVILGYLFKLAVPVPSTVKRGNLRTK